MPEARVWEVNPERNPGATKVVRKRNSTCVNTKLNHPSKVHINLRNYTTQKAGGYKPQPDSRANSKRPPKIENRSECAHLTPARSKKFNKDHSTQRDVKKKVWIEKQLILQWSGLCPTTPPFPPFYTHSGSTNNITGDAVTTSRMGVTGYSEKIGSSGNKSGLSGDNKLSIWLSSMASAEMKSIPSTVFFLRGQSGEYLKLGAEVGLKSNSIHVCASAWIKNLIKKQDLKISPVRITEPAINRKWEKEPNSGLGLVIWTPNPETSKKLRMEVQKHLPPSARLKISVASYPDRAKALGCRGWASSMSPEDVVSAVGTLITTINKERSISLKPPSIFRRWCRDGDLTKPTTAGQLWFTTVEDKDNAMKILEGCFWDIQFNKVKFFDCNAPRQNNTSADVKEANSRVNALTALIDKMTTSLDRLANEQRQNHASIIGQLNKAQMDREQKFNSLTTRLDEMELKTKVLQIRTENHEQRIEWAEKTTCTNREMIDTLHDHVNVIVRSLGPNFARLYLQRPHLPRDKPPPTLTEAEIMNIMAREELEKEDAMETESEKATGSTVRQRKQQPEAQADDHNAKRHRQGKTAYNPFWNTYKRYSTNRCTRDRKEGLTQADAMIHLSCSTDTTGTDLSNATTLHALYRRTPIDTPHRSASQSSEAPREPMMPDLKPAQEYIQDLPDISNHRPPTQHIKVQRMYPNYHDGSACDRHKHPNGNRGEYPMRRSIHASKTTAQQPNLRTKGQKVSKLYPTHDDDNSTYVRLKHLHRSRTNNSYPTRTTTTSTGSLGRGHTFKLTGGGNKLRRSTRTHKPSKSCIESQVYKANDTEYKDSHPNAARDEKVSDPDYQAPRHLEAKLSPGKFIGTSAYHSESNLTTVLWNVNSIKTSAASLIALIDTWQPHVITICEPKHSTNTVLPHLTGYKVYEAKQSGPNNLPGLAVLIDKRLQPVEIKHPNFQIPTVITEIRPPAPQAPRIWCIGAYRPPSSESKQLLKAIKWATVQPNCPAHFRIDTDANLSLAPYDPRISPDEESKEATALRQVIESHNLHVCNPPNMFTFSGFNGGKSTPDLTIDSEALSALKMICEVLDKGPSDHSPLITVSSVPTNFCTGQKRHRKPWKRLRPELIQTLWTKFSQDYCSQGTDASKYFEKLETEVSKLIKPLCKEKAQQQNPPRLARSPWWNRRCTASYKEMTKLRRRAKKFPNSSPRYFAWLEARDKHKDTIHDAYRLYHRNRIQACHGDSRKLFRLVKCLSLKPSPRQTVTFIPDRRYVYNRVIVQLKWIANTLGPKAHTIFPFSPPPPSSMHKSMLAIIHASRWDTSIHCRVLILTVLSKALAIPLADISPRTQCCRSLTRYLLFLLTKFATYALEDPQTLERKHIRTFLKAIDETEHHFNVHWGVPTTTEAHHEAKFRSELADDSIKVEVYAEYYRNVTKRNCGCQACQVKKHDPISAIMREKIQNSRKLQGRNPNDKGGFNSDFTLGEIQASSKAANAKATSSFHAIPSQITLHPAAAQHLTCVYNNILRSRNPASLSETFLHCLPKTNESLCKIYDTRGIGISPPQDKPIDRAITRRIWWMAEFMGAISPDQVIGRPHMSTADPILVLIETALFDLEKGYFTAFVGTDQHKAYDQTNTAVTHDNLAEAGFPMGRTADLIAQRSQSAQIRVAIGSSISNPIATHNVLVQGKAASIPLYALDINDTSCDGIPRRSSKCMDDVCFTVRAKTLTGLLHKTKRAMKAFNQDCNHRGALPNPSKFFVVLLHGQKTSIPLAKNGASISIKEAINTARASFSLSIGIKAQLRTAITLNDKGKALGITLDGSLSFEPHLTSILKKTKGYVKGMLAAKIKDVGIARMFYDALILGPFRYGIHVWGPLCPKLLPSLQRTIDHTIHQLAKKIAPEGLESKIGYRHAQSSLKVLFAALDAKELVDTIYAKEYARISALPNNTAIKQALQDFDARAKGRQPKWRSALFVIKQAYSAMAPAKADTLEPLTLRSPLPPWKLLPSLPPRNHPHFGPASSRSSEHKKIARSYARMEMMSIPLNTLIIVSDGAYDGTKAGAGFALYLKDNKGNISQIPNTATSTPIGYPSSSEEAEIHAALQGMNLALDIQPHHPSKFKHLYLAPDNQYLEHEARCTNILPTQPAALRTLKHKIHHYRSKGGCFGTIWIPGHVGIEQNELADKLATDARDEASDSKRDIKAPIPRSVIKAAITASAHKSMTIKWQDYNLNKRRHVGKDPVNLWRNFQVTAFQRLPAEKAQAILTNPHTYV